MLFITALALAATSLLHVVSVDGNVLRKCFNISGSFSIDLPNVYPESGDFDPATCNAYISSTGNNTLVIYHFPSATSRAVQFPAISYSAEYLLDGIDFDRFSGDVYISAGALPAFFTNGANLTGPSVLIRYSPCQDCVVWMSNITDLVASLEAKLGHPIGGFQDQAEDR
ncbi:hypothetical protein PRZ48_009704 [Zasmidium cellare]|uniref:Uncharacterized protein n=1 Tax=Zasmidium cellare TaxID=395010 RepID=A0ABR0ED55_ZASCE|nr:hypothetical protein PRZ48_009704 [Zasmidium cellare]